MQFWRTWLLFFCSNSENFSLEDWKNLIVLLQTFYKKYTCEPLECSFVNPSETLILKVQSFSVSFQESLYKFSAIWQNVPQDTSDAVFTTPKENVRSISKTFSIKVRKKDKFLSRILEGSSRHVKCRLVTLPNVVAQNLKKRTWIFSKFYPEIVLWRRGMKFWQCRRKFCSKYEKL